MTAPPNNIGTEPLDNIGNDPLDNIGSAPLGGSATADDSVPIGLMGNSEQYPVLTGQVFPAGYWDPDLFAQTVLAEFGASGWMDSVTVAPPDDSEAVLAAEKRALYGLAVLRDKRAAEIAKQSRNPLVYWADLLMTSPGARPATWVMVCTVVAVGQMVAMHFKRRFNRARPAQVIPGLMPPLLTPHHPSYPNSHALQSHLLAACLGEVVPAQLVAPLQALAARVSENREVAGFHFLSDTKASVALAPQVHALLSGCPSYAALIARAQVEWGTGR